VGDPHLDANSTRAPLTGLVDERDQAIAVLDDLLRLDPKVIEGRRPWLLGATGSRALQK
jgi:hypothetical protein